MEIEKLKYPIGKFINPKIISEQTIKKWIDEIERFPHSIENLTKNLNAEQLNWRYRPDGWTIKQVVHHCADSHMNSIIRFKLALTEDSPEIRPYYEDRWAELPDSLEEYLSDSLVLLNGLHKKWVTLLRSLSKNDLNKEFIHPEHGTRFTLKENIGIYAWHSNHHLAHIKQALKYQGAFN